MRQKMFVPRSHLFLGITFLLLACAIPSRSVVRFERTYGGSDIDRCFSVQQTSDGGYVLAGYTRSFGTGNGDVYLIKTDSLGNLLWQRTFAGGWSIHAAWSVVETSDGGYAIAGWGRPNPGANLDVYLVKTDSLGSMIWEAWYGTGWAELGHSVQQTFDGGFIVVGSTHPWAYDPSNIYVVKVDSSGNKMWDRTYGEDFYYEAGRSVQQVSDGGYVIAGWGPHPLIRTDSWGDILWQGTYGDYYQASSVQVTPDNGFVIAGYTLSFGQEDEDLFLVRTDSLGAALWQRTYGGAVSEQGHSVDQTLDGGYIVAGFKGETKYDAYLVKTDSLGNTVWERTYGGDGDDRAYSVQETRDGGYIIGGFTESFGAGTSDVYLIKTDGKGLVGTCESTCLKQDVLVELDTLKPHSKRMAKGIKQAKEHINKSLDPKYWLDETRLVYKRGKKVFDEEKKAVKDIRKLCKKGEFPDELCQRLIGMLVEADSILARVAIQDAKAAHGKEKEIEKAEKEFAKALKELTKDHPDKAIDHFKHAWDHACKAVKKHKKPKHQQLATHNRGLPEVFMLSQNYPNPVTGSTTIQYALPKDCHVRLEIYNTAGQKVMALVDEEESAGYRSVDVETESLSGGVYFCRLEAGEYHATKKMVLIR